MFPSWASRREVVAIVASVVIGGLVRFSSSFNATFPVGDGALFASMIGDVRAANFGLPAFTSFNGGDIPLAYPPLALLLGAALPFDALTVLQWLPPLLATFSIVPVFLIGRRVGGETAAVAAALFYALAPFGWYWLVQGGGLTRATGLLFALFAILVALDRRPVVTGVLAGLAALSHPEAGIFAALAVASVLAISRAWRALGISATVAALVALPWLVIVIGRHGLDPILSAASARSVNPLVAVLNISGERPGVLDLAPAVGLIALLAARVSWLHAAAALTAVLLSTSVATHMAPLMALGTGAVLATYRVPRGIIVGTGVLLLLGASVGFGNPQPLGADDRAAMSWLRANTPADAGVAVLSAENWSRADEAEWLPYLADRVSVTTMQGREWLPEWQAINDERLALVACPDRSCVEAWMRTHEAQFLYLADDCCGRLASGLSAPTFTRGTVSVIEVDS